MYDVPLYLLIVVYNKAIAERVDQLHRCADFGCYILVFDNSTEDLNNREFCKNNNIVYLGGVGNQGLSRAYNEAVTYCLGQTNRGLLCIFDDDTEITLAYLKALRRYYNAEEKAVLVPLLICGKRLISPAMLKKNFHCKLFKNKEQALNYTGNDLTALNSGMAIELGIFEDYRYDERLFLDGIDHQFMADMNQKGTSIKVMDTALEHRLSAFERPSLESALHRYKIYHKDVMVFAGSRYRGVFRRRMLKLTLQYRTTAFLKEYMDRREK